MQQTYKSYKKDSNRCTQIIGHNNVQTAIEGRPTQREPEHSKRFVVPCGILTAG